MNEKQIRAMIATQERLLDAGILIPGTNLALTRKWRLERIEQLQELLTEMPDAPKRKKVRRAPKK